MKKRNIKIVIGALLVALGLQLAYLKKEEIAIKENIVYTETQIEKSTRNLKEKRDAGYFLERAEEAKALREVKDDEKIIDGIIERFEGYESLMEVYEEEETAFYTYENLVYSACYELERDSREFPTDGSGIMSDEKFNKIQKWKVIAGISRGYFQDIFPGSEKRQLQPGLIRKAVPFSNRLTTDQDFLNNSIMKLSERGRSKIRNIIDKMNDYNTEMANRIERLKEWYSRSEKVINRAIECDDTLLNSNKLGSDSPHIIENEFEQIRRNKMRMGASSVLGYLEKAFGKTREIRFKF